MSISIDVFDQAASEKKFDDIEKNANKDISFDRGAIAKKMGIKEEDLNIPGDKYTPGVKIIKRIPDNDLREKVTNAMSELRAEQLTGGNGGYSSLTPEQKTQVDIELGKVDKDDFVNNEKADWRYNATHIKKRGGSDEWDPDAKEMCYRTDGNKNNKGLEADGSVKPWAEEQNESYCPVKTQKNSGIVINEKTKEDPDTMTMSYNGKQCAIRMGKEGFHISGDQALYLNVSGGEQIELGGQSAKHVAGAYNLSIDGVVNIYAKGPITISTDGDMNFTAKGNINFQCNGNFNVAAKGMIATKSTGETAINSTGKMSIASEDDLHLKSNSNVLFGGNGSIGMKGSGPVNINGATVSINGSGSQDASPTTIPDFNIPSATPTMPNVPKV